MPALDRSLADCRYWGQAMIYRFLRLTPMYAFTLMIYIYVYPLMGDGPNCSNTSNHDHNVISRDVSDRLLVVAGMTGDERQVGFQWKDPDFLSRNPDFLSRNPDFLSRNPDFLSRNPDFLLNKVEFVIKHRPKKTALSRSVFNERILISYANILISYANILISYANILTSYSRILISD